ncbi:MAG: membrane or secreted protein [Bacteroidia bacterium]|nr:membrane or secreted protein [Bacteroidia bacterium]
MNLRLGSLLLLPALCLLGAVSHAPAPQAASLAGAWQLEDASGTQTVMVISEGYYMAAAYSLADKRFLATWGGVYAVQPSGMLRETREFDTRDSTQVGNTSEWGLQQEAARLTVRRDGRSEVWKRLDEAAGALNGCWRITARMDGEGKMQPIPYSPRRTLKLLTGTRFHWAAINVETKQFFGAGGGTYTFANGTYTEQIEFFSRDASRVGASLSFQGTVSGNEWTHSGLSSRGQPIQEVWTRQ